MKVLLRKFTLLIILLALSSTVKADLFLIPEQGELTLNENASPQLIKIALKDNNTITNWDSQDARSIASSITVRDGNNQYLGYGDQSKSLIFIPIGLTDNKKYFQFVVIPERSYLGGETINITASSPQTQNSAILKITTPHYNIKNPQEINDKIIDKDSAKNLFDDLAKTRQIADYGLYLSITIGIILALIPVVFVGFSYKRTIESATDKTRETIQEKFTHIQYVQQEVSHQSNDIKTIVAEIKEMSRDTEISINDLRITNEKTSPEIFHRISIITERLEFSKERTQQLVDYLSSENNQLRTNIDSLHRSIHEIQKDIVKSGLETGGKVIFANKELLVEINLNLERLHQGIENVRHNVDSRLSMLQPVDVPKIYNDLEQMIENKSHKNHL